MRGVAFEYRGKIADAAWARRCDAAIQVGSWVPAVLWGVAFGNVVRGIPMDAGHNYTGTIFELAHPSVGYSLGGGGRYDGMIGRFLGAEVPATVTDRGVPRMIVSDERRHLTVAQRRRAAALARRFGTLRVELRP